MEDTYNKLNNLFDNIETSNNIKETNLTENNITKFLNIPLIISLVIIFQIFFEKNTLIVFPNYINDKLYNSKYSSLIKFILIIFICLIITKNISISIISTIIILVISYLIKNKFKKKN